MNRKSAVHIIDRNIRAISGLDIKGPAVNVLEWECGRCGCTNDQRHKRGKCWGCAYFKWISRGWANGRA